MKPQEAEKLSGQCKALGDPVRLKIVCLLPKSPNCEHRNNVSQLSELLGLTQPTISHHLKILKQAGLIESKKMCRDVFYWLDAEKAGELLGCLEVALDVKVKLLK
jgi:ArsR family transcriptional regulator